MKKTNANTKTAAEQRKQSKRKITTLLADSERLPRGPEERFQSFAKAIRAVYNEYIKTCKPEKRSGAEEGRRFPLEVMAAVKAVVGEEEDGAFDDVDSHPGSLDLPPSLARGKK